MRLQAILLATLLASPFTAVFAADDVKTESVIQISAGKVVLNVNSQGQEQPPPPPPDGSFLQTPPPFSGSFSKTLETFSEWEGFRPWKIIYLFCGLILSIVVARCVRWLIENYLRIKLAGRTKSDLDDLCCLSLGRPAALMVLIIGLYLSSLPMTSSMPPHIQALCGRLFLAFGASAIAWAAYRLVEVLDTFLLRLAARSDNNLDDLIVGIVRKIVKVCIVFVSVLFIGQNILGLNITTLLAGAGVAGLAIAFAAQDTIANFFGSLMIIVDQPFTVGDYVRIDSYEGTIERVGLRSTALRTPNGHLITIPNKTAANTSVENISRRPFIMRIADFGLVYDTTPEKLEEALKILGEIFKNHEGMAPDKPPKINFTEFKDSSLNIQVITWYHPGNYDKHLDWCTGPTSRCCDVSMRQDWNSPSPRTPPIWLRIQSASSR